MRTSQQLLRSGPVLGAAALSLFLAAPAGAQTGISVSTTGSTVSVTTSGCPAMDANGSFGRASLLSSGQSNFAQGRQATLSGTSAAQSAAWANVRSGTYTVIVMCNDGTTAGTQSIIVQATPTTSATTSPRPSPTPTVTSSPTRGVMGGIGGATEEYGTLTVVGGGALVAVGVVAGGWYLRRRAKPHRL
jgi:hypothetical protein